MSAFAVLSQSLQAQKVNQVYGIIGIPIIELAIGLNSSGITFYGFRNEQQAAYAAGIEGYLTQRPGVCVTVSGPGFTNALSGLANAKENSWPMILISGSSEVSNLGMGAFQEFPQSESARDFCKWSVRVGSLDMIPRVVERAFRVALGGRPGPVYIDLPADVLRSTVEKIPPALPYVNYSLPFPTPLAVQQAVELLKQAKRPLVVVGKGAAYSRAEEEVRMFVESTGIPFLPTPMGKGVVRDDSPFAASAARTTAIGQADVILLLGARLNWILHFGQQPRFDPNVKFINVNVDPEELSNNCRSQVEVFADVKSFVGEANKIIHGWKFNQPEWTRALRSGIEKNLKLSQVQLTSPEFNYYKALTTIQNSLSEDTILITEGANTMDIARTIVHSYHARSRLDAGSWGTMGVAMSACISAKVLNPTRPVVAIVGDSSFGFSAMELETATRYQLWFTVYVINNNGVFSGHSSLGNNPKEILPNALNPSSRYELMAEAFGGKGFVATNVAELEKITQEVKGTNRVNLVNVRISTESAKKPQTHFWLTAPPPKL
jgi:2-hydroxyacyl-CoA lyase 1